MVSQTLMETRVPEIRANWADANFWFPTSFELKSPVQLKVTHPADPQLRPFEEGIGDTRAMQPPKFVSSMSVRFTDTVINTDADIEDAEHAISDRNTKPRNITHPRLTHPNSIGQDLTSFRVCSQQYTTNLFKDHDKPTLTPRWRRCTLPPHGLSWFIFLLDYFDHKAKLQKSPLFLPTPGLSSIFIPGFWFIPTSPLEERNKRMDPQIDEIAVALQKPLTLLRYPPAFSLPFTWPMLGKREKNKLH